jgi:hypothetical protein
VTPAPPLPTSSPLDVILADDEIVQPDVVVARSAQLSVRGIEGAPPLSAQNRARLRRLAAVHDRRVPDDADRSGASPPQAQQSSTIGRIRFCS